ncbi:unnamed protein product [Ostreobium quekettii]|uniref:Uncharacterized protein n=1 Tax=Ostreobium quekettii TaxID=121088 RepID=A0A8S1IN51_9CHLO|nr:unnamed protein product [Ostreobium quekettii]
MNSGQPPEQRAILGNMQSNIGVVHSGISSNSVLYLEPNKAVLNCVRWGTTRTQQQNGFVTNMLRGFWYEQLTVSRFVSRSNAQMSGPQRRCTFLFNTAWSDRAFLECAVRNQTVDKRHGGLHPAGNRAEPVDHNMIGCSQGVVAISGWAETERVERGCAGFRRTMLRGEAQNVCIMLV